MTGIDGIKAELTDFTKLSQMRGPNGFFGQEVLRFYSVVGTTLSINFELDETATPDERYITHPLFRSLSENLFWILYIFDDSTTTASRYDELINSFKREYGKLLNDSTLPDKHLFINADPSWRSLPTGLDVNSMLAQIRNVAGDRMNFLYFIYRVGSFDTHGKSLQNLFATALGSPGNFPVLKIRKAIEYMVNEYLAVLSGLRSQGVI
jgi:hypothetical protein